MIIKAVAAERPLASPPTVSLVVLITSPASIEDNHVGDRLASPRDEAQDDGDRIESTHTSCLGRFHASQTISAENTTIKIVISIR